MRGAPCGVTAECGGCARVAAAAAGADAWPPTIGPGGIPGPGTMPGPWW